MLLEMSISRFQRILRSFDVLLTQVYQKHKVGVQELQLLLLVVQLLALLFLLAPVRLYFS
jgi:hypothetical protein